MADRELLRRIPKIDVLLAQDALARLCDTMPYEQVRSFARSWVDDLRADVLAGRAQSVPDAAQAAEDVASRLSRRGRFHLKRVVNATGIVLHTNLGRAPLGEAVSNHVAQVARGYCNLEYNLEQGRRGSRYAHVEELICELTGAEAACVVNNNAGAVFLVLDTLCKGEAVAISRGELVEIGGSFRVPDIMARSGARLIEVGTTNKTHVRDYEDAIRDGGATTLLKVHTSNFVMRGFTESVSVPELARVAAAQDPRPLVIYDAGAALLVPPVSVGIPSALSVRAALEEGADVVSFSGDKLVGSAQAGIIVGRRDLVEKIKRNQLCRMLRVDKLSLAALEMTFQTCLNPARAIEEVPTLHMLSLGRPECRERVVRVRACLEEEFPAEWFDVVEVKDEAGGGSLPGVELPGAALSLRVDGLSADELERGLRAQTVPVITRVRDDAVLLSGRTLQDGDEKLVRTALGAVVRARTGRGGAA